MEKTVDLRGLLCPEPVLRTKKLLDDGSVQKVEALVESEINVNNLQRLARSLKMHFSSSPSETDDSFRVVIERKVTDSATSVKEHLEPVAASSEKNRTGSSVESAVGTVVFLSRDRFGEGDPDFSNNLLNVFLQTLLQSGHRPRAILLANTGVKLMDPEGPALKVLNDFREVGVEVLACGLCVDYYGLKGKIPTEQITNMFAICEFLMSADKVIQP